MNTRRLSLEQDFMNYKVDDLLYGAMAHLATYHPIEKKLYLTVAAYRKNVKNFASLLDCDTRTVKRHLDALIKDGLIVQEKVKVNNKIYDAFVFIYDYNSIYQLVDNDLLWYIVSTRNKQGVKIYNQLLDWYLWKQKEGEEGYVFTNRDLMRALGYSTDTPNSLVSEMISNILESFSREGVIKYADFKDSVVTAEGKVVITSRRRLQFVARTKAELLK